MSKIIKVTEEKIVIGLDDGNVTEARREDLSFEPEVGDEVDIYKTETEMFVTKKKIRNSLFC